MLSVVVGALLLVAAGRGARTSSTVSLVVGALFLLSGFVHLAVLDTNANLLGFGLSNVLFSFAAGVLLLTLGAYGRISGGLAPDNPYARAGNVHAAPNDSLSDPWTEAETAAATQRATPEQRAQLRAHRVEVAGENYDQAWRGFAATHSKTEVARMQNTSFSESSIRQPDRSP